jgi:hypothetical protein
MLRRCAVSIALVASILGTVAPAHADSGPVIAIPTRPGVPIVIHGRDASYAVVEGDWGLARPGHGVITVIGSSPIRPNRVYEPRNSYHPRYGRAPERGRYEVEPSPDRPMPDPAENFSRSWSNSSDAQPANDGDGPRHRAQTFNPVDVPATITDPATYPQNFNPPVIVIPRRRGPAPAPVP